MGISSGIIGKSIEDGEGGWSELNPEPRSGRGLLLD
jgi:hypothetical protein